MNASFDLTRRFALLSFACILLISLSSAVLLSRFLTDKLLTREATLTRDFIANFVQAEGTWRYFGVEGSAEARAALDSFVRHVARLPDALRANVFAADGTVLWSSDAAIIGRRFLDNHELEASLRGELTFESGIIGDTGKAEHHDLEAERTGLRFVETYVPIWNADHDAVVGSVELYKVPLALHQAIVEGARLVWLSALGGGILLYAVLFQIVKRANGVMREQQRQLVESERLTMVGETASAVAHAMRNPLASIRACAELTLTDDLEGARESANDIISEADRLERWARELLEFSRTDLGKAERVEINALVDDVLANHAADLARGGVKLRFERSGTDLPVRAAAAPLAQVIGNLVMNAVEAMIDGGTLTVTTAATSAAPRQALLHVRDTGPGLSKAMKGRLFRPFATTKPTGTGLGLALSQRLVQRYDGTLSIDSVPGKGLTATVRLPLIR